MEPPAPASSRPVHVPAPPLPAQLPPPTLTPQAAVAPIPDVTPSAIEFLQVLVASKLKKDIAAVAPQTTLKSLVGGNSTAQNEILGDIEGEFELKLPENVVNSPSPEWQIL